MPEPGRRVAVITGASAGVGRATARLFAQRGWDVGLLARGADGLEAARREAEVLGARAIAVSVDVADAAAVEAAASRIEDALGPIDCWINNAMVTVFSPVKDLRPREIERVTQVTYLGSVHGTLAALKRMLPRDRGVIVQVGSALAYRSIPLQAAYCGAKHAVQGFLESLRCELLHDHSRVRVTMVQLPALNTPQFGWVRNKLARRPQPVPPIYQPEVAARAILWAAEHPKREYNVGYMTTAAIVRGPRAPGLVDRYLARTGYAAQQTSEPVDPRQADNLFEPVLGDHGAHGAFDDRSHRGSLYGWWSRHKAAALAGATVIGLLVRAGADRRVRGRLSRWARSRGFRRLAGR
ncbi:MAG: SDR family oxidoreductase [Elusimicrobia bacterium]|nr:SDR family oxidoreductase [Elusimicrobiota bacterium]